MGRRGRRSFEVTDAVAYGLPSPRLRPPSGFGEAERRAFVDLVASAPASQFQPVDLPLLIRWAELVVMCETAAGEMTKSGMIDTDDKGSRPGAWFVVYMQSVKALALLALRLRVGPQCRSHMAPKTKASPMSYYDLQRLGGSDAEDETDKAH
jgi:hypothetical protein